MSGKALSEKSFQGLLYYILVQGSLGYTTVHDIMQSLAVIQSSEQSIANLDQNHETGASSWEN